MAGSTILLVTLMFALSVPAVGDELVLTSGRRLEGRLVSRDSNTVRFEIHKFGKTWEREYDVAEVTCVIEGELPAETKTAKQSALAAINAWTGPAYFVIPIHGTFGLEVTDATLKKCIAKARKVKATVIVFEVDSTGGRVSELIDMLKTLEDNKDIRFVAYIKQAASAAAFFSMACPDVVMSDTGMIGACVIYRKDAGGIPKNIEEKFESAARARFRAVVASAGHDPLLVEGMMRTEIVLSLTEAGGKPRIVKGEKGDKIFKAKDTILSLTGQEAIECGLSVGLADSAAQCNTALNIDEWREASQDGIKIVRKHRRKIELASRECIEATEATSKLLGRARQTIREAPGRITNARQAKKTIKLIREYENSLKHAERRLAKVAKLLAKYPLLEGRRMDDGKYIVKRERVIELRYSVRKWRESAEDARKRLKG